MFGHVFFAALWVAATSAQSNYHQICGNMQAESQICIGVADPLIKQVHLIFPDNPDDLSVMCSTWNGFIDCLHKFTQKCYSDDQQRKFREKIAKPLASVNKMCTHLEYQKEYLQHAPCIKNAVADGRCGPYYSLLIREVEQAEYPEDTSCCTPYRFKECMLDEIRRTCDRGAKNGPAVGLTSDILSNIFSSTADCTNYVPNPIDCPIPTESSPSEVYSWRTTPLREKTPKDLLPARPSTTWLPPAEKSSAIPWEPSPKPPPSPRPTIGVSENPPVITPETIDQLAPRSRPSSFGRSSSWLESDVTQPIETKWNGFNNSATTEIWTHLPTTWYPAAGSQLSNEVDEPNQLGLVKPEHNTAAQYSFRTLCSTLVTIPIGFYVIRSRI